MGKLEIQELGYVCVNNVVDNLVGCNVLETTMKTIDELLDDLSEELEHLQIASYRNI